MDAGRVQRVHEVMSGLVQGGEYVQGASVAGVGRVSLSQKVAVAAVAIIASGGAMGMAVRPTRLYVVLTNQRLLGLRSTAWLGNPKAKIAFEVPRSAIPGTGTPKQGFSYAFDVLIRGQNSGLRLTFPRQHRADGEWFAAALGLAPQ
jgi:hypothetical protein